MRIDLIEFRDFHCWPGFDRTLGRHAPEGWAVVCWPRSQQILCRLTLLNGLSRTDWDPGPQCPFILLRCHADERPSMGCYCVL